MRSLWLLFFCTTVSISWAQNQEAIPPEGTFTATVINAQTNAPLESVHIINLNQIAGTITNYKGKFTLKAAVNDTLYLSYLGFKSQKVRITGDMLKFGNTQIALNELAYALEEVILKPYQLTGYLEIDIKNLPLNNNARSYSISGLATSYEGGSKSPSAVTKVLGAVLNPADLLRNLFGKKPQQMRKLRQIKQNDAIRDLLASKFDRETLTELLQLDKVDLEDILNNCNYSRSFINTANDLQILDAISSCYEEYRVLNRK